ncbi:MAG TPA: carbohydrate kinase family protein [Vicinamibacterales bacterium]
MFDVAGLGVSAIDLVYVLPAYPAPEGPLSKLPIHAHFVSPGGQTATAMAACAALGLRAAFLGATGSDAHGALVREELTRRGVDISQAVVLDGPQPYSIVLLAEGRGERIVLWRREPGRRDPVRFSRFRLLHVDDIDGDGAIAAAKEAREAGRLVTTDIDQVTEKTKDLIQAATHPILAEHVPGALTGERDLARALRLLRPLNAGPLVVTLGARGAAALDGDEMIEAAGFRVDAVDTTGAGDVFRAGFIAALLDGAPLKDILRFANAAAAISCTRRGAMASVPTRAEVERALSPEP